MVISIELKGTEGPPALNFAPTWDISYESHISGARQLNGRSVALVILTGTVLCPCVSSKSFHEAERNTNDAFQVRVQ